MDAAHDAAVPPVINTLFLYWGRRGLSQFAAEISLAASRHPGFCVSVSVSRYNEEISQFAAFGQSLMKVNPFATSIGALTGLGRARQIRSDMADKLRSENIAVVVTLNPHVWLPLVVPVFREFGVKHYVMVHDAVRHPGDLTGLVNGRTMLKLHRADRYLTLSSAVTEQLILKNQLDPTSVTTLFHPDLAMPDQAVSQTSPQIGLQRPWHLLFLGRINTYKGLPLLVDAVEQLKLQGRNIDLTVMGEGNIGSDLARLSRLGASVINRWLQPNEIASAFDSSDVVVLPYVEASQSGIVAMAHGRGLPVIVTPVGGLKEQVEHRVTGIVTSEVSGASVAGAICEVFETPGLISDMRTNIQKLGASRHPARFVSELHRVMTADGLRTSLGCASQ
jgi:glycosyltransferase involved in cell wall biosynthesis